MQNLGQLQLADVDLLGRVDDRRLHLLDEGGLRDDAFCVGHWLEGVPLADLIELTVIRGHRLRELARILMALVGLVELVVPKEHVAVVGLSNWGHGLGMGLELIWPLQQSVGNGNLDLTEKPRLLLTVELLLLLLLTLLP